MWGGEGGRCGGRGRKVWDREGGRCGGEREGGVGERGGGKGRKGGRVKREGERRKRGGWVYRGRRDEEETNEMNTVLHSKRVDFEYGVLSAAYTG